MALRRTAQPPPHFARLKGDSERPDSSHPPRVRASGTMERYHPEDPRVDPDACEHTQVRDKNLGAGLVWCLDCGAVLDVTRGWSVVYSEPPLQDSELLERRVYFNNFNFDQLYKPHPSDPDDPKREAEVEDQLRKQKITRLKVSEE